MLEQRLLLSVEGLDVASVSSRSRGRVVIRSTGSKADAIATLAIRTCSIGSRCVGKTCRVSTERNGLPRSCLERHHRKRRLTRLYKKSNNENNDGNDVTKQQKGKQKQIARAIETTASNTINRGEYNPISDFLYGANYVHSQYLSILWRYSIVRSLAVTLPIGIAICFDERYGLCDAMFGGLRSVFVVSSAAARLLQLPLEVAQSLVLNVWNASPEATTRAIDFLPSAVAIPVVGLALSVRATVTAMIEIGRGSDALRFLSSLLAILVWRPAVEEWQYRSILDKLLFAAPRWTLARLRRQPLSSSSTRAIDGVGEETRSVMDNDDDDDDDDDDDGDVETVVGSPPENETTLPTEEIITSSNQTIVLNESDRDPVANRSIVNKLLFGAPRWVLGRKRRKEPSAEANNTEDLEIVDEDIVVNGDASHTLHEPESSLPAEEAVPVTNQTLVSNETEVNSATNRSIINKLLFGAPRWVLGRRRRQLSPTANDTMDDNMVSNAMESSAELSASRVQDISTLSDESAVMENNDSDSTTDSTTRDDVDDNDEISDEGEYTLFLPDESTRILLGSLLFATTRLGWLSSDPADTVSLSNSPYGFTIGFIQSIFSLLSSGQATAPEVRHGLRIFILLLSIHQTVSTFLVAQHVFAGIYRRRGLAASVGAHVSWTIGKGTIPFRLLWKFWQRSTAGVWKTIWVENDPEAAPPAGDNGD